MKTKTAKQNVVGLKELREDMEKYIREVDRGKSFTVLRRSRPIFKLSPVDSDESDWETVVDFTSVKKEGISGKDILKSIKKLNG